jgi:predicted DsbA family dithiol-disulfide isomerase
MITIDVVSDVVCPWCYVGKRRLEAALETLAGQYEVAVTYHPFQLDPSVPAEGRDFLTYMNDRFGGNVLDKFSHVEDAGRTVGLDFDFAAVPKAINTLGLHRLLEIAKQEGQQAEAKEALMKAYFVDPLGWSTEKTTQLLASDTAEDTVREEMYHYRQLGVSGVPFFVFNNKYAVSGAQPAEVLVNAIRQIAHEMSLQPKLIASANGDTCDVATGAC